MKKEAMKKSCLVLRMLAFMIMLATLMPTVISTVTAEEADFYLSENYAGGKIAG